MKVFRHIRPTYDRKLIYARLGYKRGTTALTQADEASLEELIQKCEGLCDIAVAYRIMGVQSNQDGVIILEDGTVFKGKALGELLSCSDKVVLMASTAGRRVGEAINGLMSSGRASEAVVLDAAASEIADAGLDFVMDNIRTQIRKAGKTLTRLRFSPGYGDFVIEQQRDFARLLDIGQLGMSLTEACMLLPEKSVMAIAGIVALEAQTAADFHDEIQ